LQAEALSSAISKLKSLIQSAPNSPNATGGEVLETWICGEKVYPACQDRINILIEAILRRQRCRVAYRKPSRSEAKTYDFDPYCLLFVGGGLYAVGRVPPHTGTATLAVDRLHSAVLSQTEFQVAPDFDLQKCRRDAFGVSWEDPMEIVLRFRSDQVPYVRERIWHPSQMLTDLPGGDVQLAFRAGGLFEIRRWILGWGDAVEVIAPKALRHEIEQVVQSTLAAYRNQSPASSNLA
jgi:predicted DNA-binding transcriptional regulator YafY